ncbi:carbohydrate ABC transporter permease [Jiangella alkaliphila]|uniref:Carbohydrate ABC transporter membrane protein 1, CUT1 family n=1 Tax=Jiangella alkaliphila TaxID=419479 RepID=A0A1H2LGB0_9ACTN|nr:sugar ABC transporter permease [Jiangella alkaliphila]SDU79882.1 carbohydrate ABC transporter membrane protein 1, CUT1 family [Jiangella alkaliphila]
MTAAIDLPTRSGPRKQGLGRAIWDARHSYALMIPGLILISMFSIYPMVMSWYYAFFRWDGYSSDRTFIGFGNFVEATGDPFFWDAFWRSLLFAAVATPIELVLSLALALLLNDASLRFRTLYRTAIFIPVVTTTAVVAIVMSFVFSAFNGPANQVLSTLRLVEQSIDFLGDPQIVLWAAIGIFIWKWVGQPMIYWLAALQTIPGELYEAARVDGAGLWQQFRNVTAPLLTPFAVMIALIVTIGNLQVFAFIQALTGGGPNYASELMEVYIYRIAFGGEGAQRLGYASAAGVLFGLTLMIFGVLQFLAVRRARGETSTERDQIVAETDPTPRPAAEERP